MSSFVSTPPSHLASEGALAGPSIADMALAGLDHPCSFCLAELLDHFSKASLQGLFPYLATFCP